jgi:predicted CopG family antitoxin
MNKRWHMITIDDETYKELFTRKMRIMREKKKNVSFGRIILEALK